MTGPYHLSRVLAATMLVGSACAVAVATTDIPGSPPRIAAPCSPDGHCLPRYETWGWYPTRWRTFPGDPVSAPPLEAEGDEEGTPADELSGPETPGLMEENQVGPQLRSREAAGGADAPAPTTPGDPTLPGLEGGVQDAFPPVDFPTQPEGGLPGLPGGGLPTDPAAAPPGTDFEPGMIDPFGAARPTPPAWMVERTGHAAPANEDVRAAAATLIDQAPNMQGDDAPPALPTGLQDLFSANVRRGITTPAAMMHAAAPLRQPARVAGAVRPKANAGVVPASAQAPATAAAQFGIQLINPASAMTTAAGDQGLQQAIYFEASDLGGEASSPGSGK